MRPGLDIIWHEPPLYAVNKPAGLPVYPRRETPDRDTIFTRLPPTEHEFPYGYEGGIAHRLDNSTSGQLLLAENPEALAALRDLFGQKSLRKSYLFITAHQVPWDDHTVAFRIAHDRHRAGRMVIERGKDTRHRGKWIEATTVFRRVGQVGPGLWCWQAEMRTGVMHQIRLHAASVGIALAGDRKYGGGPLDWPHPEEVEFLLHHVGLEGPDLHPTLAPVPTWWPELRP